MSRLIRPWMQGAVPAVLFFAIAAALGAALFAPSTVIGQGIPLKLSEEYSSECKSGKEDNIDPVTVLFRGPHASANKAAYEVGRVAEWEHEVGEDQLLKVKLAKKKYGCRSMDAQRGDQPMLTINPLKAALNLKDLLEDILDGDPFDVIDVPSEQYHVRLWFVDSSINATQRKTLGTPHHEYFKEWNNGETTCKGVQLSVLGVTLFAKGNHAVKQGGVGTGEDSGFDEGRQALRRAFSEHTGHKVSSSEDWGNDERIKQCDGNEAGSNGNGITIQMNWVNGGYLEDAEARPSSARVRGRLETTKSLADWWLEYGPSHSEGASSYPNKTSVKSVEGPAEIDVSRALSGLSPNSSYYVRMFVRDEEGNVDEGNEVEFKTCGWERGDEDDNSRGPGAATPECGGAVDSFYRDVNGDLGHQSWSPIGAWSTETRPAAIAHSAVPRVLHRADGSGVVDVFFRETDGDLGHHWWTPGSGWQEEALSASMASDPNVIERPDGTIDVFYRTASGELGHQALASGGGWTGEVRNATVSSEPHAIAHEDGSIDVFYRSGSSLGRDLRSAGGVWSRETRSGSLVAEPRPLIGKSGAVDVFYRTSENKLGHDWFVPGTGWSRETRSASLASDPHVVKRPDGTIDVFYRTSGNELGHDWWVSGSGWSTETRPGDLSSDPHVVARSDGSLEVFYREGNQLGRQSYVPEKGWSVESRRGPIAGHTDPHLVAQSNGRIDVIYETPSGQLGRDAFAPGPGWSHELRPMKRPSRPVAAYSLDTGEGTVAEDLFGEHDGAIEGATWFDNGRFGKALSFDGENDCVTVADAPDLQLTEEFTLETWVKPQGPDGIWEPILFKEQEGGGSYSIWLGAKAGQVEGYMVEEDEEWKTAVAEATIGKNVWAHIALTYDGAWMRLYIDGELADATYSEGVTPSSGPLSIGCSAEIEENYGGLIDEVRIYDRALGAGEVAADMGAGLESPSQTPVAAYSFDTSEEEGETEGEEGEEGEGPTVEDLSGSGHKGFVEGAEWTNGKYGRALKFDGESQFTIPAAEDLNLTEAFTLEAWIKPEAEGEYGHIFVKEDSSEEDAAYVINKQGSKLAAHLGVPAVGEESPTESLEIGSWQHVAATFDGGDVRLYVDGQLVGAASVSEILSTNGALRIGGSPIWGPGNGFTGRIDEVRIYNRALSEGEIQADGAVPIQTPQRTPIVALPFDEGEGGTAFDLAGEHDGTIEGASWFDNGRFGKALSFDGENDCVTVADAPDLQLSEEFTLETWVKPAGSGESEPILVKETPGWFGYMLYLGLDTTGHLEGYLGEEGEVTQGDEDPSLAAKGAWSHVALTFDGHAMRLYVNGEHVGGSHADGPMPSTGPLSIGCSQEGEEHFNGRLDEVRIYDRALDPGEVAADIGRGVGSGSRTHVAAYSLDTGEGAVAEDLFGEHDGAIEGAEWFENGRFGSALSFDGANDCVTVADAPDLQLTEEFTLEAWVRPGPAPIKGDPILFKEAEGYFSYSIGLAFQSSNGKLEGYIGDEEEENTLVVSPEPLPANVWAHVALTYDGANMRLYLDGELVDTTPVAVGNMPSKGPLEIGCAASFNEYFDGKIDEVRIYDRALGTAEVATDMGQGLES